MLRKTVVAVGAATLAALVAGAGTAAADDRRDAVADWNKPSVGKGIQLNGAEADYPGAYFMAMAPKRVLDTRSAIGTPGTSPVGQGGVITLSFVGQVPTDADAVVLNLTGTETTGSTFVTAWPNGLDRPGTSNLNLVAGETRPNAVTVPLGPNGDINLYNHFGSTHLIADLAGYYTTVNSGGSAVTPAKYNTMTPTRVLDTRNTGAVGQGGVVTVDFTGQVAADATSVNVNLTGVGASQSTFVTAWPSDAARPTASSLNLTPGSITPNNVTVQLSGTKKVSFYNHSGVVNLVVDLAGYYSPGSGSVFFPTVPFRTFDTRNTEEGAVRAGESFPLFFQNAQDVKAFAMNVTGVTPTANTFVTVWPSGQARPTASVLNLVPGQIAPNAAIVGLGTAEWDAGVYYPAFDMYNHAGDTHLVYDIFGYFGAPVVS